MSLEETGAQWDLPYGWGNIEMVVLDGLRRYGFNADADRVSYEFLSTVALPITTARTVSWGTRSPRYRKKGLASMPVRPERMPDSKPPCFAPSA